MMHRIFKMDSDLLFHLLMVLFVIDGADFAVQTVRLRKQNISRDREAAMARLNGYSTRDFKRRFRMWRWQFDKLIHYLRKDLEPQTFWAKQCAINSSGSWVKAELKLAATLRVLAGGSYLDAADLYAVSANSFHRNTFWPTVIAVCNCPEKFLNNIEFPFDNEEKLRRHEATFSRFHKHFQGTAAVTLLRFVFSDTFTKVRLPLVTVVRSKFGVLLPKKCPQMYRAIIPENTPGRTDLFCFVTETSTLCQ